MTTPTLAENALIERIEALKKERNAVILAHNYQVEFIQEVADLIGDSLELSLKASKTDADVIVFCGVHFMAETAAIVCPGKTVIMPDLNAGCGMADMISAESLRKMKAQYPGAAVVCYVNTSAEVKAESDYCCTSANAVKVVQSIPENTEIIFVPDRYLARHVERQTGRKLIIYNGFCPTHLRIVTEGIVQAKAEHPDAEVLVHPECTPEVIDLGDKTLSTSGICRSAHESTASEFIVATETGIINRLRRENPEKTFVPACSTCQCSHMKMNTLEKLVWALEDMDNVVTVPEEIRLRARRAVDRMLAITG